MARNELIYSVWAADETPLTKRAVQVLTAISKAFPKVTVWEAGHRHDRGIQDQFFVDTPYKENEVVEGFNALELWQKTVEHFAKLGLESDFITVQFSAWSDELADSVGIIFNYFDFIVDDSENQDRWLSQQPNEFLQLLKNLGSSSAIGGVWLLNHSAFAGDPACLYEPKKPFNDYYNVLKYQEALGQVRPARQTVRAAFTTNEIAAMLKELGAKVESIGQDRLFVQFDEKLGGDGSKQILPKLEQQITARLGKEDYRMAA